MDRILTIAHLTFVEARRRRIAMAALLCGALFVAVFWIAIYFIDRNMSQGISPQRQMQLGVLSLAGLYAAYFLSIAVAILFAVDSLSGEIGSGVMQTVASKPVHRVEIVLGKFLTHWLMSCAYLLLTAGGILIALRAMTGYTPPNALHALPLMLLGTTAMVAVSMAGSASLTTVTNGIVAFAFYGIAFIGGWIEQIGTVVQNDAARRIGTAISLVSPVDALWRRAAFELQAPLLRALPAIPFGAASIPSHLMTIWAAGFAILAAAIAVRQFQRRAL